jgi:hypothetical protein
MSAAKKAKLEKEVACAAPALWFRSQPASLSPPLLTPAVHAHRRRQASIRFSHIHIYQDTIRPLAEYKELEASSTKFSKELVAQGAAHPKETGLGMDIEKGCAIWAAQTGGTADPTAYKSQKQDVAEQLILGAGWRITGHRDGAETRTVCLSSSEKDGVNMVVTCAHATPGAPAEDHVHFRAAAIERFHGCHRSRQGISVLCFEVEEGDCELILGRYSAKHPKLVVPGAMPYTYADGFKVIEVYAYYKGECVVSDADEGTILRFIERPTQAAKASVLAGLNGVEAEWCESSLDFPAFCDHWVSNVISRQGFLQTLNDGLGFTPQVEFNAGVVAAGEARIESTVCGNKSAFNTGDKAAALKDQSQVYLPINNALSEVGHVHWFIEEVGQGVQHVASRVGDLVSFIQHVNDLRKMTGHGFCFLNIPRSYYGSLSAKDLVENAGVNEAEATAVIDALLAVKLVDNTGILKMDTTHAEVASACADAAGFASHQAEVTKVVLKSRYSNLYKLLRDHVSEGTYLRIVRNQILVDGGHFYIGRRALLHMARHVSGRHPGRRPALPDLHRQHPAGARSRFTYDLGEVYL